MKLSMSLAFKIPKTMYTYHFSYNCLCDEIMILL